MMAVNKDHKYKILMANANNFFVQRQIERCMGTESSQ